MNAAKLVTVEEHTIGTEDRVFFGHQDHDGSEPMTAGTKAGWYWQSRGSSDCWGPFTSRKEAALDYDECEE